MSLISGIAAPNGACVEQNGRKRRQRDAGPSAAETAQPT
jgi:hypothetical protein